MPCGYGSFRRRWGYFAVTGGDSFDKVGGLTWVHLGLTNNDRVAVISNVQRDSNGQLRVGFNSSALGPGDYQMTLEGVDCRGGTEPQAWVTFAVVP